jgi:hypothetical protein
MRSLTLIETKRITVYSEIRLTNPIPYLIGKQDKKYVQYCSILVA